jgi:hypothetical protein
MTQPILKLAEAIQQQQPAVLAPRASLAASTDCADVVGEQQTEGCPNNEIHLRRKTN